MWDWACGCNWYKKMLWNDKLPYSPNCFCLRKCTVTAAYNFSVPALQRIMLHRKYMGNFCQAITPLFKGLWTCNYMMYTTGVMQRKNGPHTQRKHTIGHGMNCDIHILVQFLYIRCRLLTSSNVWWCHVYIGINMICEFSKGYIVVLKNSENVVAPSKFICLKKIVCICYGNKGLYSFLISTARYIFVYFIAVTYILYKRNVIFTVPAF